MNIKLKTKQKIEYNVPQIYLGFLFNIYTKIIMKMKDKKYIQSFNEHQENLNISDVIISQIEELIDEKMDELIGKGDYKFGYSKEQNRFIVSFREGDIESSCEMADEVVDYVNNHLERNILRVGNCGKSMFWLT